MKNKAKKIMFCFLYVLYIGEKGTLFCYVLTGTSR
jgi:hypothetical protein